MEEIAILKQTLEDTEKKAFSSAKKIDFQEKQMAKLVEQL